MIDLSWLRIRLRNYRAQLRLCLRVTVAALLAFVLAQPLDVPLSGLWAVLTAIVVTQISVGGSLQATTEYVVGTIGGAIYASAIALLVPHTTGVGLALGLALTMAPLAFLAAVSPRFRVAPFTGVLVLMVSHQLGEGPITAALYRLLEVAIGGLSAIVVSLLVLPERAHALEIEAAARALDLLAQALPKLMAGFMRKRDERAIREIQDGIGQAVLRLQNMAGDAQRERLTYLAPQADPAPLSRTLLRLRHDFIIIARAGLAPLPECFAALLGPPLEHIGANVSEYLGRSAGALRQRRPPPPLAPVRTALEPYAGQIAALRSEGLTRDLPSSDLERCVRDCARAFRRRPHEQQKSDVEDSLG